MNRSLRDQVADDVYSHPGTTRAMVAARTGLRQGQVRHYLRWLVEHGALTTGPHERHRQRLRYFPPVDEFSEAA